MRHIFSHHILVLFAFILLLASCHKKEEEPINFDRTVIVYMMAENSLSSYTQGDINELTLATDSIPANCRLVVYYDGSENFQPCLYEVKDQQTVTIKTYTEQNSCDGNVFQTVLRDISKEYPSDSYSLVMWSHGSGWIPGKNTYPNQAPHKSIGVDNGQNSGSNTGAEMDIPVMRQSIEQSGLHFDCILFDACFMQTVEVAYELRHCADYIIGSPAEIPAYGAPYHRIMTDFFRKNPYQSAEGIANHYFDYYKNRDGLVISVVKTSELENLAKATSSCLPEPEDIDSFSGVQKYCPWSGHSNWFPDFSDMASIMNQALDSNTYTTWESQMKKTIPVRLCTKTWVSEYSYYSVFLPSITDEQHFAGMSMFLPSAKYEPYGYNTIISKTQWWQAVFGK